MERWEEFLAAGIACQVQRALGGLSFTRLVWLTENIERAVLPFLRGDLDRHLKGVIPPMPLREVDAAQFMLERDIAKPFGSP